MDKIMIVNVVMLLVSFASGLLSGMLLSERPKKKSKQINYAGTLYIRETDSFKNYNLNVDSFEDLDKADSVTFRVERNNQSV